MKDRDILFEIFMEEWKKKREWQNMKEKDRKMQNTKDQREGLGVRDNEKNSMVANKKIKR